MCSRACSAVAPTTSPSPRPSAAPRLLRRGIGLVTFALEAVGRRRRFALAILLSTYALVELGAPIIPPTYAVEARIFVRTPQVLPALASRRARGVFGAGDPSLDGLTDLMSSRESLKRIVEDADLAQSWSRTRTPVGRLMDRVRAALRGPPSERDLQDALVAIVERAVVTYVDGDVVVTYVEWHDPGVALQIAEATQQRFFDLQRETEETHLAEAIAMLEPRVDQTRKQAEEANARLLSLLEERQLPASLLEPLDEEPLTDEQVATRARLERELRDVQAAIADVRAQHEERRRAAEEALAAVRASFGAGHPNVEAAERALQRRTLAPQELSFLLAREAGLRERLDYYEARARSGQPGGSAREGSGGSTTRSIRGDLDPDVQLALAEKQERLLAYRSALAQLDSARIERDVSRAAFHQRYLQTLPPRLPHEPERPDAVALRLSAIVAGLVLALFFCVWAELRAGRVVVPWQLEDLGVPVLGRVCVHGSVEDE